MCVWFIHIDADATITATIDFGGPILGYLFKIPELQATSQFELPSVDYVYRESGRTDTVTTTGSMMVLDSQAHSNPGDVDQIRVFVGC